jgi:hypothetical protein
MAGDLQPNESQCRVCEAESSVASGRTAIYFERNRDTECDTSLRLVCLYGCDPRRGCVLRGARRADGSGLARAQKRSWAWRERKRAKTSWIIRRQIIRVRAMESRMIRSCSSVGAGGVVVRRRSEQGQRVSKAWGSRLLK